MYTHTSENEQTTSIDRSALSSGFTWLKKLSPLGQSPAPESHPSQPSPYMGFVGLYSNSSDFLRLF